MKSKTLRISRGFTLVELLVVIAIIAILATLLLLQLGVARAKARDAKRIADVNQVRSALELYFDDHSAYLVEGTSKMSDLTPKYLVHIPADPMATCTADTFNGAVTGLFSCYGYTYDPATSPTKMQVWANLEQANQNATKNDTDIDSSTWLGGAAGAKIDAKTTPSLLTEKCDGVAAKTCVYDIGQP